MTSSIPPAVAWPFIVLMAIVVTARYQVCTASLYDHYYNNTAAFLLLVEVLRNRTVEDLLAKHGAATVTTSQELSLVAMMFAAVEFIGFMMLWTSGVEAETRVRQRCYRISGAILAIGFLVAAAPARAAGQPLEAFHGWSTVVAWMLYLTMWFVLAVRLTRLCVTEIKGLVNSRERFVVVMALALGVVSFLVCAEALGLAATDQLGWTNTVAMRLRFHSVDFDYEAMATLVISAVPLVVKFQSALRLDAASRALRKLEPLRRDLLWIAQTRVFDVDYDNALLRTSTLQLHQAAVEIRDAALHLRAYFREFTAEYLAAFLARNRVPAREHAVATHALHLAHAAKAKNSGNPPTRTPNAPLAPRSQSAGIDEETAQLLTLAKWWPPALASAEAANEFPTHQKVAPA